MNIVIKIVILSFLILSCSKKEMIHVSAKNPVTGVPYAGLRFTITEEKTGTQEIFTKVYDSNLNSFGEALFEFKLKKNRSYKLSIETPTNNCYKEPANITFAIQDESFDFKFELVPCAFLKFRYHNMNCINEFDKITVNRTTNLENYVGFIIPAVYNECEDYIMSDFVQVPMGNWYFNWEVTKNGVTNIYYDTIFLNDGEQKYYEFNY
jgi:hypothetical protein